jgi:hypothetical protein
VRILASGVDIFANGAKQSRAAPRLAIADYWAASLRAQ